MSEMIFQQTFHDVISS